uniref:NADH dehydrogenase subunit 6 n=1 Tax=Cantao ocellatus TaxID=299244 RepID=A0A2P1CMR3_9HEMI|nr:NADH dehydrogenase subunit 6 [Cantao ocellatus]AVJ52566.1 NADH dehydrogenase subunit 6 [Cantao ocellatus]QCI09284.1 NADH dehydrogenase subunit 6 [Cantao ocellatus]
MLTMLYSFMITMSLLFLWLSHPMSMGFILIIQTMIIALISGIMINNFFFSYIIMIIMLSGALVLFIYMSSVASNKKFSSSISTFIMMFIMIIMSFLLINIYTPEHDNWQAYGIMTLTKLYNSLSAYITIGMMIYLLITMIVVSFIASSQEGPLRMKTYE